MYVPRFGTLLGSLVVICGFAVFGCSGDGSEGVATGPAPGTPGRWEALPEDPLSPRFGSTITWTGSELVVFGGHLLDERALTPSNEGASYDPVEGRWTMTAEGPFDPPLYAPVMVWSEEEVIVVGVPCEDRGDSNTEEAGPACFPGGVDGAAYDPADDSWREIGLPEVEAEPGLPTYTPTSIGWTGSEAVFRIDSVYRAYDPSADQWRDLPDPPFDPTTLCVTEVGVVAAGATDLAEQQRQQAPPPRPGEASSQPFVPRPLDLEVAVLAPNEEEWSDATPFPDQAQAPNQLNLVCADDFLLSVPAGATAQQGREEGQEGLARFDVSSRRWAAVEPPPFEIGPVPTTARTDDGVVLFAQGGVTRYVGGAMPDWQPVVTAQADGPPRPRVLPEYAVQALDRFVLNTPSSANPLNDLHLSTFE